MRGITAIAEDARAAQRIPGLALAIGDTSGIAYARGFGLANAERGLPATPACIFRYASVSKPITATAAMRLAERGTLDLDSPVQRYVPAYPHKPWPVTARQLSCHVAGIRHYANDAERLSTRRYASLSETLELIRGDELLFEPGTRYSCTSYGYNLLACAMEGAAGKPLLEILQEEVFVPAGMAATRAGLPEAAGYGAGPDGAPVPAFVVDTSDRVPGGGLCGTAGDLVRFALAFHEGRLVRPETKTAMCTVQRTRDGTPCGDKRYGYFMGHGLGWLLYKDARGREVVRYGGLQSGARAMLYLMPESGVAAAAVANKQPSDLDEPLRRILDLIL
ncbi:MAG: beta-lactamase family protein [Planctomycetes bacterium]|nr:beta-lactamase family protein [Planctomycetota bacterium]